MKFRCIFLYVVYSFVIQHIMLTHLSHMSVMLNKIIYLHLFIFHDLHKTVVREYIREIKKGKWKKHTQIDKYWV